MFRGETKNCKKICFLLIGIALMMSVLPVIAGGASEEKVMMGSIVVNPDSSFSLPLFIENATGVRFVAMDIFFEKSGLQMASIDNEGLSDFELEYSIDNPRGFANMTISSSNITTEEEIHVVDFNFLAINSGNYTIVLQNVSLENDTTIYSALSVANGSVRVNHPPQMDDIGDRVVDAGSDLIFSVTATDHDDAVLNYDVEGLPEGYYLNSSTGFFSWIPETGDIGTHIANFSVSDGFAMDRKHVNINVTLNDTISNSNNPPVLDLIGDKTVNESQELTFTLNATDADNDSLVYSLSGLPVSASLESSTGLFSWTPGYDDSDIYTVDFVVSDGRGGNASESVNITVVDVNRAPVLSSIGDRTVNESELLTISLNASDADAGDVLTYSCNASFGIFDSVNGIFNWAPASGDAGNYYVEFDVSDDKGSSDYEVILITVVEQVIPNTAPVLAPIGDKTVNESQELTFILNATDVDNDTLVYSLSGLPASASLDSSTGLFTWTPGFDAADVYSVEFSVSDGIANDSETITITVYNVDRAPVLDPIGDKVVDENILLSFTISATDPDDDTVTYSATYLPVGANLDATTGEFTWTAGYDDSSSYDVEFIASANGLTDSETITITVNNVDRAPVLDPVGNKVVDENTLLSFIISATDPDGDTVTYSGNDLPAGAYLAATTGEFAWTPGFDDAGDYEVEFIATANGLTDSETITITVNNVDRAPILDSIGNKVVDESTLLSFIISATDPDGDTVTYSVNALPAGANLDATTGEFTWTPGFDDAGDYEVEFIAWSNGLNDSETITITVNNVNRAPTIEPIADKLVNEKEELIIVINATDADGDDLYYSKDVDFGTLTGNRFSWTPDYDESGLYDVVFNVSDGYLSSTETVRIAVGKTNRPPVLDHIGSKSVNESESLSFIISASDPNTGDTLTYHASGLPSGASFDSTARTFHWVPSYEQSGSYNVLFEVSDGMFKDSELVTITVHNLNRHPVLSPINDKTVNEGSELRFTIYGTDPDQTSLSYTAIGLPDGSSFNEVTRDFVWTPSYEDSGVYNVSFTVSDGSLSDSETISIDVIDVNRPPVLDAIGNKAVDPGSQLSFIISGSDPDLDPLTYSAAGVPSAAHFNENTREFTWTPDYADHGTHNVTFTASDGSLSDSQTISINVGYVNRAPVLDAIGDKSVNEGSELRFTISGSDPDSDHLTYSAASIPSGASFDIITREFIWTPGYEASGTYSVTFTVSDGFLSDSETISIDVINVNRPPLLSDIGNKEVDEASALRFTISGSDPDSDPLSYSAASLPAGANFNPNTREFVWTPDHEASGTYSVIFTVSDGSLADQKTVVIKVNNVNRAPVLNPVGNKVVSENSELLFSISGSDPDSDKLTYSSSNMPEGATFNPNTRQFRWKPDYESSGIYIVSFHVSDGKLSDSETIIITVNNVNRAPVLDPVGNKAVDEGNEMSFTVSASDPDQDQLTYTATGIPSGSSFNAETRQFTWTPGYDDSGTYTVIFRVSDGSLTDSEVISISVGSVNRAPDLVPIGDRTIDEGSTLSFIVSASDPDIDPLSYSVTGLPSGSTFNVETRQFTWTPGYDDEGTYSVTFKASDGSLSDSETILITVNNVNRPPRLMVIGPHSVNENEALTISMDAHDDDGDTLYYSVDGQPEGSQIDTSTGVFTWTPTYEQAGIYQLKFIVSDGLAQDTEDVKITVNDVNRPPVFDPPSSISVAENTVLLLRLNGSDPDGDFLSYSTDAHFGSLQGDLFTWTPGYEDEGIHSVIFTAEDGEFEISRTLIINVTDTNSGPVLYSISDTLINELETVTIKLEAVDIDGDELTFYKDVDYGNLDPISGEFTWTPGINDSGFHRITFTVSDGELNDSKIATIAVGNTNIPPVIIPMEARYVRENETIVFTLDAYDVDNEPLVYSASGLPIGAHLENSSGVFTWTPTYEQAGIYTVEFRVSDKIYTAIDTVIINVENVNRAPVFADIPTHTVNETGTLRINLNATDPDGDWLSFSTTFAYGKVTGNVFTWTPGYYDSGDHYIEFNVSDGSLTGTTTAHVKVTQTNMPPEIETIGSYSIYENETLQFFVNATDGDSDPLTYSASGLPRGASFDHLTRQFTWRPDFTQSGTYSVEFRVTDGELNASEAMSIRVFNVDLSSNTDLSGFQTSQSSGGSGGAAASGAEDYNNVAFKDYSIKYVTMGKDAVFEFPNVQNDLDYVKFSPLKAAGQVKAIIEILEGRSTLVSANPPGNVYRHINIWVGDAKFNSGNYISSAEISFKVEKKWLTENNADPSSIKLYRYSSGSWGELPTSRIGTDVNYYYYRSRTPGFSPFAIVSVGNTPLVSSSAPASRVVEDVSYAYDYDLTLSSIGPSDAAVLNSALQADPAKPVNVTVFFIGIVGILIIGSVLGYSSRKDSVVLSRYYAALYAFYRGSMNAAGWVRYKLSSESIHKDYAILSGKLQKIRTADYKRIYDKKITEIKERQRD